MNIHEPIRDPLAVAKFLPSARSLRQKTICFVHDEPAKMAQIQTCIWSGKHSLERWKIPNQSLERINLNVHHTSALLFLVFHLCSKCLSLSLRKIADQDGEKKRLPYQIRDTPRAPNLSLRTHQPVSNIMSSRLVPRHVLPNVQVYTPRCQVDWWSTAVFLAPPPGFQQSTSCLQRCTPPKFNIAP